MPNFNIARPKHAVLHNIETRGQPVRAKARPLPPQKLAAAKTKFAEMASSGIVRRSNGPWSSPLHVVTKQDGSFRMCGDYHRLNTVTTPDRYSIPLIADLTARLHGRKFFGKVDLIRGYHQVPVAVEDIAKTAITMPFGTYEFLRMPFGLKNAGQTFQRMMDEILSDLDYLFVYMDDVLIASRSLEDHTEHFRELFRRLSAHDLVVNPSKCQFGKTQIEFLGHAVTKERARRKSTQEATPFPGHDQFLQQIRAERRQDHGHCMMPPWSMNLSTRHWRERQYFHPRPGAEIMSLRKQ